MTLTKLSVMLAVLVLAFLAWAKWDASRSEIAPRPAEQNSEAPTATAGLAAVDAFVAFATASPSAVPAPSLNHDYTADGLRKLSAALDAIGAARPDATDGAAVAMLRSAADRLQADPRSLAHADIAREAFGVAADAIGSTTRRDVTSLEGLAASIDPDVPLLRQMDRVRAFFRAAAMALAV